MSRVNKELKGMIADEIKSMGYILWGLEVLPGRVSCLIRVYIDSAAAISVADCAKVNRQLSLCLRGDDCVLEVSSPGLARKFFQPEQYNGYIGQQVRVRTKVPINGQRNFSGCLVASDEQTLSLLENDEQAKNEKLHKLMHSYIERGQLEPDYSTLFKK